MWRTAAASSTSSTSTTTATATATATAAASTEVAAVAATAVAATQTALPVSVFGSAVRSLWKLQSSNEGSLEALTLPIHDTVAARYGGSTEGCEYNTK